MPRRILLLITDLEIGGVPGIVRELAVRLRRDRGMDVEAACLARRGPVAEQIERAGIAVTALGAAGTYDLRIIARLIRLIHRGKFDGVLSFLVHANVAAAAAAMVCPGVRFVQCIHTTQPRPRWHWYAMAAAHMAAKRVVACSQSVADALRERSHVPADKIVVVPNAIDADAFAASPAPLEDTRPFPIGFVGRLDPVKRVGDVLNAVKILNGLVHLHVFGDGRERANILASIQRLGIAANVTMHGMIPDPRPALARIGMMVLPSQAEGFPMALLEAMAAGVPIVACDVPGVRDVVTHEQTAVLTSPRRPDALAVAIKRVVEDRALRLRLRDAGMRDARERFTWARTVTGYERAMTM